MFTKLNFVEDAYSMIDKKALKKVDPKKFGKTEPFIYSQPTGSIPGIGGASGTGGSSAMAEKDEYQRSCLVNHDIYMEGIFDKAAGFVGNKLFKGIKGGQKADQSTASKDNAVAKVDQIIHTKFGGDYKRFSDFTKKNKELQLRAEDNGAVMYPGKRVHLFNASEDSLNKTFQRYNQYFNKQAAKPAQQSQNPTQQQTRQQQQPQTRTVQKPAQQQQKPAQQPQVKTIQKPAQQQPQGKNIGDATKALNALGYKNANVQSVISQALKENQDLKSKSAEEIVKFVLPKMKGK